MEGNVVECEVAERGVCACGQEGRAGLAILRDVHKAYEERLEVVERVGGKKKLQMQVEVLRSWVGDLVGQNTLLARAVEELEAEATTRLLLERTRHSEMELELRAELGALRRRLARKDSDLRGLVEVLRRLREFDYCSLDGIHFFEVTESDIFGTVQWRQKKLEQGDVKRSVRPENRTRNSRHRKKDKKNRPCNCKDVISVNDSLQKENLSKDREIRRLMKDAHQYEQTIVNLRSEISMTKYHTPDSSKKDAEVMAGMCCTRAECGGLEVGYGTVLKEEAVKYQERIHKMEINLKSTGESVRALRKVNVALSEEMHALRRVCAALDEQCRASTLRAQFKDEIIREMRRQLKQAKAKLRESEGHSHNHSLKSQKDFMAGDHKLRSPSASCGSLSITCVRQQPRRKRDSPPPLPALPAPPAGAGAHRSKPADTPLHPESDDCRTTPRLDGSGDDAFSP